MQERDTQRRRSTPGVNATQGAGTPVPMQGDPQEYIEVNWAQRCEKQAGLLEALQAPVSFSAAQIDAAGMLRRIALIRLHCWDEAACTPLGRQCRS